ncbi:DUF2567 domain-containing protein [Williamsia soli]|uniref:DUF2567 domain-containing protein n=1 Tax=Williamsia soli TaxID=364929 RepID=UPI001A9E800D|nr:DUF2567 domain-containing protein [Williamsia soli]
MGSGRSGLFAAAGVAATGIIWGAVWALLTPGIEGRAVEDGRAVAIGDATAEFGAIARFFCLALAAGVVLAIVFWYPPALRGPLGVVGLSAGAVAAGIFAIWVGDAIARQRFSGRDGVPAGGEFTQPPTLRIDGAHLDTLGGLSVSWVLLVVAPLTALVTYFLLVVMNRDADLGHPASAPHDSTALDSTLSEPSHS